MLKAEKLIDIGLSCRFVDYEETAASIICLEVLAKDLVDLLSIFQEKLVWLSREHEVGDIFSGWSEQEAVQVLNHFKAFYNDAYEKVKAFAVETNELLSLYGVSVLSLSTEKYDFMMSSIADQSADSTGNSIYNITEHLKSLSAYDTSLDFLKEFPSRQELRSRRKLTSRGRKKTNKKS